jgi:hypothetical protein
MCNTDDVICKYTQNTYYKITSAIFFENSMENLFIIYVFVHLSPFFLPLHSFPYTFNCPCFVIPLSLLISNLCLYILGKYLSKHTVSWEQQWKIWNVLRSTLLVYSEVEGKQTNIAGKHTHINTHSQIHTGGIILEHKCKRVHVLSRDAARPFDLTINPIRQLLRVNTFWWGKY